MQHLTTLEEFTAAITTGHDCVVDFYAPWCGPCKMIAPTYEALAAATPTVWFYKVNVDDARDISRDQDIRAMPTFIFYRNGQRVASMVGGNKAEFQKKLQEFVGEAN